MGMGLGGCDGEERCSGMVGGGGDGGWCSFYGLATCEWTDRMGGRDLNGGRIG